MSADEKMEETDKNYGLTIVQPSENPTAIVAAGVTEGNKRGREESETGKNIQSKDPKRSRIDQLLHEQDHLTKELQKLEVLNQEEAGQSHKIQIINNKKRLIDIEQELDFVLNNPDLNSSASAASSSDPDFNFEQQEPESNVIAKLLAKCTENAENRDEQAKLEKELLDDLERADPSLKIQKALLGQFETASSSEMEAEVMEEYDDSKLETSSDNYHVFDEDLEKDPLSAAANRENMQNAIDISKDDNSAMGSEATSTSTKNPEQQPVNWEHLCERLKTYIDYIILGIYGNLNHFLLFYYLKHCLNKPDKYKNFIKGMLNSIKNPLFKNKEVVFEILKRSLSAYPVYYPNVNNSFLLHEIFYFLRESKRMLDDVNLNMENFDFLFDFVNTLIVLFTFYDGSLKTIKDSIAYVISKSKERITIYLQKYKVEDEEEEEDEEMKVEEGEEGVPSCTNLHNICELLTAGKSIDYILKCLSDKINPPDATAAVNMDITGSPDSQYSDETDYFNNDENSPDFDEIIKFLTLFLTIYGIKDSLYEKIDKLLFIAKLKKYKNLLNYYENAISTKIYFKTTLDEIVDFKIEDIYIFVNNIFQQLQGNNFTEHEVFIILQMMDLKIQLEFENYTDLLLSVITESNREYFQLIEHCMNVQSDMNSMLEVYENLEVYEKLYTPKQVVLLSTTQQQQVVTNPLNNLSSIGSWFEGEQRGGADTDFCAGRMLVQDNDDNDARFNLKRQGYCALGCSKLLDELKHDFKPYLKGLMPQIESIYKKVITFFHKKLVADNSPLYPEVKDVVEFMDLVSSYSVGKDPEWNYYTSVLKFMDEKCGNIDELTIVKVVNLADYKNLNVDDDYKRKLVDSEYLYMTMECGPVSPIFILEDLWVSVEDNSVPQRKMWPLVYTHDPTTKDQIDNFKKSFFTIDNGPGMLDPKTTGPVSIDNFSPTSQFIDQVAVGLTGLQTLGLYTGDIADHIDQLKKIQASQNINIVQLGDDAKEYMMEGLRLFLGYFGVPLDPELLTDIRFIVTPDQLRFMGINITMSGETIPIHIGDTTKEKIADFVKECSGNIPDYVDPAWDASWQRLHYFAKAIYEEIPLNIKPNLGTESEVLTMIILSLKSLGDLWQVFYSKKLAEKIFEIFKIYKIYISSTDKNVGSECFLNFIKFILNGTGVRPHLKLLENPELLRFFGKENFQRALVGADAVPDERDIDGSDTITTNLKVATPETYISSINVTLSKIIPHLDDIDVVSDIEDFWNSIQLAKDDKLIKELQEKLDENGTKYNKVMEEWKANKHEELQRDLKDLDDEGKQLRNILESLQDPKNSHEFQESREFQEVKKILEDLPSPQLHVISFLILSKKILNRGGKFFLFGLLINLKKSASDSESLKALKEIDIFLKKIYEVIKLTEPDTTTPPSAEDMPVAAGVPSEGKKVPSEDMPVAAGDMSSDEEDMLVAQGVPIPQELQVIGVELQQKVLNSTFFQKIKTLTSFLKCNFIASFNSLRSKKTKTFNDVEILKSAISIERKSRAVVKKVNIFDKNLLEFAEQYMEHEYKHVLVIASTAYENLLSSTQVEIEKIAVELVLKKEDVRTSARKTRALFDPQEAETNFALAQASETAKMQELKKKIEESKDCILQLVQSMEKQNKKSDLGKTKIKLDKQRTALEKLQTKLLAENAAQKQNIANKIKDKFDKNNPENTRKNISTILTSMATTFSTFITSIPREVAGFGGSGKFKKRKTRKNIKNKIKKRKTNRKTNKKTNRKTKYNKTIKKQRPYKKRKTRKNKK
jgi:hypothetical protein